MEDSADAKPSMGFVCIEIEAVPRLTSIAIRDLAHRGMGGGGGVRVSRNCWDFPGKYWGCVLESFKERLALMNFYVVRYNHGSPSNVADPAVVWFKIIFGPKLNWSNLKLKSNKKIV